ncbi:cystathionine beta-lyase [Clostridia bacterium]|nr:cystathionine beta-lyase [Clostridia bacterium]
MNSRFDQVIERKNTLSLKYDFHTERNKAEDVLPLWVADMDFPIPEPVQKALQERVKHGIFGYSDGKEDYNQSVIQWFSKRFSYRPAEESLVKTPGVVYALAIAVKAFTKEGDSVLIQNPVYYPFADVIQQNNRKLVTNPLIQEYGKYRMDFEDLERKIQKYAIRLMFLCSPHNPVGRVWTKEELLHLGEICFRHGCIVVSDEIHCDFVFSSHEHIPFPSLSKEWEQQSILCTAPSKTFNLAGLQISNIFIANPQLREQFIQESEKNGYSQCNIMGLIACQTAYEQGEAWLEELKTYLRGNISYLQGFIQQYLPKIRYFPQEATYLAWLDCSALFDTQEELESFIEEKAKLWLDSGTMFGEEGKGFMRLNLACPKVILERAMEQLRKAYEELEF